MTDPAENLTLEALDTWSRAHGYGFSRERLAAVLPEVRRLREATWILIGLAVLSAFKARPPALVID